MTPIARPALAPHLTLLLGGWLVIAGACQDGMKLGGLEPTAEPWVIGASEAPRADAVSSSPEPSAPAPCEPNCVVGACGDDGCGGSCGPCSVLIPFCYAGWCQEDPPPKEPTLELFPALIDFGPVAVGEALERTITLTCKSKEPVQITHFAIAGDSAFEILQGTHRWRSPAGTEITVELLEPWTLEPGQSREVVVSYTPVEEVHGMATLRLLSNDASAPDGHLVVLHGGPQVACAAWEPEAVDFGATMFGTTSGREVILSNCGTLDLSLDDVSIAGDDAGAFTLQGTPPESLSPGERWYATVTYSPTPGSVGASGTLEARVTSDDGEAVASLDLNGFLVLKDCPVAKIGVNEQAPVEPGTIVHLSAANSYAPGGTVTSWLWGVEQPLGGVATFFPSTQVETPTFQTAVVGLYRFDLSVFDAEGTPSCTMASSFFTVKPEAALYVQLTWETPGDVDPTNQGAAAGADLDLHLAHPSAAGVDLNGDGDPEPWFDPLWDCYWFNGDPDWGPFQPPTDDDPHLTVQDIDGAGPEAIAFNLPEVNTTYRLAVHAWNDHGFGPSAATVRVYLMGELLYASDPVSLETGDLWEVAEITWLTWPEAEVSPLSGANGDPIIFENAGP